MGRYSGPGYHAGACWWASQRAPAAIAGRFGRNTTRYCALRARADAEPAAQRIERVAQDLNDSSREWGVARGGQIHFFAREKNCIVPVQRNSRAPDGGVNEVWSELRQED